jgi:Xaa-Pro aminopeptidase
MVKSETEIAILTKACKIQDAIFKRTFEAVETGMILHIEPGCIEKDGIYVLEEQVLVTESGRKVLSHAPWELQT